MEVLAREGQQSVGMIHFKDGKYYFKRSLDVVERVDEIASVAPRVVTEVTKRTSKRLESHRSSKRLESKRQKPQERKETKRQKPEPQEPKDDNPTDTIYDPLLLTADDVEPYMLPGAAGY